MRKGSKDPRRRQGSSAESRGCLEPRGGVGEVPSPFGEESNTVGTQDTEQQPMIEVDALVLAGLVLRFFVTHGWLVHDEHAKGGKYLVTAAGEDALLDFGISFGAQGVIVHLEGD